jgi:hypothetical protein
MLLENGGGGVFEKMGLVSAFIDTQVQFSVAVLSILAYLKTEGVAGNIADKDQPLSAEYLLSVKTDPHWRKRMRPETSPYRPKIIEMAYMSGSPAVDSMNYLAVKSEAAN